MKNYLIEGLSGSGKSTAGRELARRGYRIIEADSEPGLSSWVDIKTGKKARHRPPFSKDWLARYHWDWDKAKLDELLDRPGNEVQILVGGADNMEQFLDRFIKKFFFVVDSELMKRRLQTREPRRWRDGSAELARVIAWNEDLLANLPQGVKLIDGSRPVEEIADEIIGEIDG